MMDDPLRSDADYELFIYSIVESHHKHVPPDIKHNRIPAPEMSFAKPNLPVIIAEIEAMILSQESEDSGETDGKNAL